MDFAFFISVAVIFATSGDILLSKGMRKLNDINGSTIKGLFNSLPKIIRSNKVIAGIISMTIYFILYLYCLSIADVTYVNPLTALSYVTAAVYMSLFCNEKVSFIRWVGIFAITVGAIMVGITS